MILDRATLRTLDEKVRSTGLTVYNGKFTIDHKGDGEIMYFNAYHDEYRTYYVPVEDICDIGTDFVMVDELKDMIEDTVTYFTERSYGHRGIMIYKKAEFQAQITSAIEDAQRKNSRRKWVFFNEAFPQFGNDWRMFSDYMQLTNGDKFEVEWRKDMPRFAHTSDIIKSRKERIPPKPAIYKLGKTRTELRDYWMDLIGSLNRVFESRRIPINITSRDRDNVDLAIAFAKKNGITIDHVLERIWFGREGNDERKKVYRTLYRSPTKYKVVPKKREEAIAEKLKKEVDAD